MKQKSVTNDETQRIDFRKKGEKKKQLRIPATPTRVRFRAVAIYGNFCRTIVILMMNVSQFNIHRCDAKTHERAYGTKWKFPSPDTFITTRNAICAIRKQHDQRDSINRILYLNLYIDIDMEFVDFRIRQVLIYNSPWKYDRDLIALTNHRTRGALDSRPVTLERLFKRGICEILNSWVPRVRYKFAEYSEDWKRPSSRELENSFVSCVSLRKECIDIGRQISAMDMHLPRGGEKKTARMVYLEKLSAMRKVRARSCAREGAREKLARVCGMLVNENR